MANVIKGDGGNNTLPGTAGEDEIYGYGGNDYLTGGAGADILDGGIDYDAASYEGSSAGVWVDLANSYGSGGDAEGDTLYDSENVYGSSFDDTLIGDANANVLLGFDGHDGLRGGA